MKRIIDWIAVDGLLHFLVCYAMMLAFAPIIGLWWSMGMTVIAALSKEVLDYIVECDNNTEQVHHDLICDGAGLVFSLITILIWTI